MGQYRAQGHDSVVCLLIRAFNIKNSVMHIHKYLKHLSTHLLGPEWKREKQNKIKQQQNTKPLTTCT